MDALLARYLDGDLSEPEAAALLEAAAKDPRLEAELRAYERILAAGRRLPPVSPGPDFTDRVMERVRAEARPERAGAHAAGAPRPGAAERSRSRPDERRILPFRRPLWSWPVALPLAASLLAFFGAGYLTARVLLGPQRAASPGSLAGAPAGAPPAVSAVPVSPAATASAAVPGGGTVRIVRLIYVATHPDVKSVSIAGSFNNWDPAGIPLQREGGAWSALLALPPGFYEYMFVEDGERWVSDPHARETRDDGFGGTNAILDLTT